MLVGGGEVQGEGCKWVRERSRVGAGGWIKLYPEGPSCAPCRRQRKKEGLMCLDVSLHRGGGGFSRGAKSCTFLAAWWAAVAPQRWSRSSAAHN